MYYTYVLINKGGNFYVGYTRDLKIRFEEHCAGNVISTKSKLPVKLVYYEACINQFDALKREKYLKSGPGRKFLKNRLKQFMKLHGLSPVVSSPGESLSNFISDRPRV